METNTRDMKSFKIEPVKLKYNSFALETAIGYRGLSQTKLCNNIKGLSQSNLSKFLKGNVDIISEGKLIDVMNFLDFPMSFLMNHNIKPVKYLS